MAEDQDVTSNERFDTGGMASLQVASAHLQALLSAHGVLDQKALFVVGVNVALLGLYFAPLAIGSRELWAVAPSIVMLPVLLYGWWKLKPRNLLHYPSPSSLMTYRDAGFTNDDLAWAYMESIDMATQQVRTTLHEKERAVGYLAYLTLAHIVALTAVFAVLLAT